MPSIVVNLSFADFDEEKDLESWGRRVICMDEFKLEKPVEASILFLRRAMSAIDCEKILSLCCRAERFMERFMFANKIMPIYK